MGSRLQSKWEFLKRKNNETVYFHCLFDEKSIDPPWVPVALCLQHNNSRTANSGLIWKKTKESNLLTKMWTAFSSPIIKVGWSCNCCLRKIISTLSGSQKTEPLFSLYNRHERHLPGLIQPCGKRTWRGMGVSSPCRWHQMVPLYILCKTWARGLHHLSLPLLSTFLWQSQLDLLAYVSGFWAANDLLQKGKR